MYINKIIAHWQIKKILFYVELPLGTEVSLSGGGEWLSSGVSNTTSSRGFRAGLDTPTLLVTDAMLREEEGGSRLLLERERKARSPFTTGREREERSCLGRGLSRE